MENMDVNPEAEMASNKPSKTKAFFAAVLAVVLVLGGVYYFVFGQDQANPPSLGPGTGTFQGLIKTGDFDFLTFSQPEIDAWVVNPAINSVDLNVDGNNLGLFTIFSTVETTGADLLEALDHNMTGEFMFAVYDNATTYTSEDLSEYNDLAWITSEQDFYQAVGGLLTKLDQAQLENYKFAPYKSVVIYSNKDTKIYGDWHLAGEAVTGFYDFCSGNAGWTNAVSSENLTTAFKECVPDEVFQIVTPGQNEGIKYEEVLSYMDVTSLPGNNMIWVYYEDLPGTNKVADVVVEVEGCDEYENYENTDEFIVAAQTAVADLDFAAAYCLLDEDTKAILDTLIDSARGAVGQFEIGKSADVLSKMIPEFMDISKDAKGMGQILQFFESGHADVLYDAYVQNEKETAEKVLEGVDGLLPELVKLVSPEGDNLAFLKQLSVIAGKVRSEIANIPKLQQFSKDLTDNLEMVRHADAIVEGVGANMAITFVPVAPYNTVGGVLQDKFKVAVEFITNVDGSISVVPVDLHTSEFQSVDENGTVTKYLGIEELFEYYAKSIKKFVDAEGAKFQLFPDFLNNALPFIEDYADNKELENIIGVLKNFIEYSTATGGNVTLVELTGIADANGLQFTSNQYSQWLGFFYGGEPYVAPDGKIMYLAGAGSEGNIDYASYIVGAGTGDKNIGFMDLFGDTALTVKIWTINVQAVQQFTDEELASFNFFIRGDNDQGLPETEVEAAAAMPEATAAMPEATAAMPEATAALEEATAGELTINEAALEEATAGELTINEAALEEATAGE
ncbi:MAG: hypothetical protein GWP15_01705, partial [Nitrospirae bacterium]|nr:hypothetical protein [Nitrospirota bacterium]